MPKRINLGSSRLEKLTEDQLSVFLDKSWIHLGDEELKNQNKKELNKVDYSKTNFKPFYFKKGDRLNLEKNYYEHIFSEHFFEHLFLDGAIELFKECYKVLKPNGVMRIVVPDADLRPIPEKVGFPGKKYSWDDKRKHKTRWSIYSLKYSLELSGYDPLPIKYYDRKGRLQDYLNKLPLKEHEKLNDLPILSETRHIKRKNSLIIDAIAKK